MRLSTSSSGRHGLHDGLNLAEDQEEQGGQLLDPQGSGDALLGVGIDDREAESAVLRVDPTPQGAAGTARPRGPGRW